MADEKTLAQQQQAKPAPTTGTAQTTVGPAKTPREALEQERLRNPVPFVAASVPTDFDTPFKVLEEKDRPKLTPQQEALAKEKAELLKKIQEILKAYGDREADIPSSNEYWQLVGKYRTL